jgi:hypothetical protein
LYINIDNRIEQTYVDGKLNGESQEWYVNGKLAIKCHYKAGEYDSFMFKWNTNGKLRDVSMYKHDTIVSGLNIQLEDGSKFNKYINHYTSFQMMYEVNNKQKEERTRDALPPEICI